MRDNHAGHGGTDSNNRGSIFPISMIVINMSHSGDNEPITTSTKKTKCTKVQVQHLSFEYFTSRGVTLAGAKAANRV